MIIVIGALDVDAFCYQNVNILTIFQIRFAVYLLLNAHLIPTSIQITIYVTGSIYYYSSTLIDVVKFVGF